MKREMGLWIVAAVLCAGCTAETTTVQPQDRTPAPTQMAMAVQTTTFEVGEPGFEVIGQQGRVAVMAHDLIAGQGDKHMWFLWGDTGGKSIRVLAEQQATGKQIELLGKRPLGGPLHGADGHLPTSLVFPDSGMWRMDVYVDDAMYGQINVSVKEAYPSADGIEIRRSADEFKVNGTEYLEISVKREQTPNTMVVKAKQTGSGEPPMEVIFHRNGEFLDAADGQRVATYSGSLRFPMAGEWEVEVLGKTVNVTVQP